ncbi:MAG: hypothetical protein K2G08_07725 [Paramuribaculum sp.]|nr:hypothetical protein [Paramuribaculum sp.]
MKLSQLTLPLLSATLLAVASCSGSSEADSAAAAADSARMADSLRQAEQLRLEAWRTDSLRRDSLTRDSLFEAHALRLSDFIAAGTNRFLDADRIVANLRAKGYEPTADDHPGGDRRLAQPVAEPGNTVSLRYSEPYAPMIIDFADTRSDSIFVSSLADAGFATDETGNYVHPANTPWAAAVVTVSGRRIFMEWMTGGE